MARPPSKPYFCALVAEQVTIALRRRPAFSTQGAWFVRCSEVDCQWVDTNQPPCPLTLDLFAAELEQRRTAP